MTSMNHVPTTSLRRGNTLRIALATGVFVVTAAGATSIASAQAGASTTAASQSKTLLFTGIILTPEQRTAVNAIHARSVATIKQRLNAAQPTAPTNSATKGANPDFSALRDSAWAEIRLILTAEQRTTFDHNVVEVRRETEHKSVPKPVTKPASSGASTPTQ